MRNLKPVFFSLLLVSFLFTAQSHAAEDKSMGLFINLTTAHTGQAGHAAHFAGKMMERGHPVTFFLNHQAVVYASKSAPLARAGMSGKTMRDMLSGLMKKGAKVIVCQMCAKMNGVKKSDLIDGASLGTPELVSSYLFDPKYQVISW